jgi:hypothetical protein
LAFSGLSLALYIGFSLAHSSPSQPQIKSSIWGLAIGLCSNYVIT